MATRVAVGNHKGGSGKTAITVGLAAALAEAGRRVLVVDMDPQANASRRLGRPFDPDAPTPTTAEVIANAEEGIAAAAIQPSGWPERYRPLVDVIPARFDLDNRMSQAGDLGAVHRLAVAMTGVDDDYDVTLIDCQPSLAHLTQMALAAAHVAVAVVDPEYDGVDGAIRYRDFIGSAANRRGLSNPNLRLIGVIVNRLRAGVGAHAYQLEGLPDEFGADLVWTPYLPERAVVKDAGDAAVPVREWSSTAARQHAGLYADLANRLLKEIA